LYVNDIGKKQLAIAGFDQDDMFRPEVAYRFANIHIDWLERKIYSPVFIAYAYNGGLGLVKKMLQRGDMFNKGKFEPWLSMELVPYAESRDYGKKVLANFIIYSQILDPRAKVSVQQELQDLLNRTEFTSWINFLKALPYLIVWAIFAITYATAINREIRAKAVLISSLVASILWWLSRLVFAQYVFYNKTYLSIYGSFSVVLFFFLWIYISWIFYLNGVKFCVFLDAEFKKENGRQAA